MKKTFASWLQRKVTENESPFAKFQHNSDHDLGVQDYEKLQKELIDMMCNRYSTDFFDFVDGIANQRNDEELASLARKINGQNMSPMKKPRHPAEPDIVVSPLADRGSSETDSE